MMRKTFLPILAAIAAGLAIAPPAGAAEFTFPRTFIVEPIVFETFVSGEMLGETPCLIECFYTTFNPEATAEFLLKPQHGVVAIGYDYARDPGAEPCPCSISTLAQYRAGVSFSTLDIPDAFHSATLVLEPKKIHKLANSDSEAISGLFQTEGSSVTFKDPNSVTFFHSFNRPFFTFDRRHDHWTLVTGEIGFGEFEAFAAAGSDLSDPVFSNFPATTGPDTKPVTRNGDAYRIDVTHAVRKWIADWPNRLDTPVHTFLIASKIFTPANIKTLASGFTEGRFLIEYAVTLEIILQEPDR